MTFPFNRQRQIRQLMAIAMQPKDNSNEKVAYDLMQIIAQQESIKVGDRAKNPRTYYLELYSQCLRIVSGEDFDDVADDMDEKDKL